jgi:hypothetical protein
MSELQQYTKQEFQNDFAVFIDRLKRWHSIDFDKETMKEFISISSQFNGIDFNYCHERLRDDEELIKRYKISPTIVYKLCLESKNKREKSEKIKSENSCSNSIGVNTASKDKVDRSLVELGQSLKDSDKNIDEASEKKLVLYDYLDLEGNLKKVITRGDIDEVKFKKACRDKFWATPHTIKKVYYKMMLKEQTDKSGNSFGSYSSFDPVSSTMEGAKIQTVGFY